jgi:hypothetical protein
MATRLSVVCAARPVSVNTTRLTRRSSEIASRVDQPRGLMPVPADARPDFELRQAEQIEHGPGVDRELVPCLPECSHEAGAQAHVGVVEQLAGGVVGRCEGDLWHNPLSVRLMVLVCHLFSRPPNRFETTLPDSQAVPAPHLISR